MSAGTEGFTGFTGFSGRERLLAAIDAAMAMPETATTVAQVERALLRAMADPAIRLPAQVHRPVADHYARRELCRSARHGYSVVAMTWGPGQHTPLHDHDGLWCVEGIWQGTLQITPYRLLARTPEACHLVPLPALTAQRGSAGNLIPPDEYHVLHNPSATDIAVSLHVYQRPMEQCTVFVPEPNRPDWYRPASRSMTVECEDAGDDRG
ncbi:cysteine dioxygenase family protein [Stenotrophomonas mori]|uniref:Cysteine dioxygenase family protein n=1 Tax=Stenotrophomonas mori TaxID=2871096 RepID=A0ABT0SIG2_9GAMM|nr:cysteine dioxygenase family protein [Stenotrophomonas mori]MCL7714868.1 cysteine dioxygenase family protein [Stenotrophomonas mori]